MEWTDATPARGHVRYRIRRECVDKRYEWLSEEGRWPAGSRRPFRALVGSRPVGNEVEFEVEVEGAAAGTLEVRLYDVQGRMLMRQESQALGAGRDLVRFALGEAPGPLANGIYFLRVVDSIGQEATARLVVLK